MPRDSHKTVGKLLALSLGRLCCPGLSGSLDLHGARPACHPSVPPTRTLVPTGCSQRLALLRGAVTLTVQEPCPPGSRGSHLAEKAQGLSRLKALQLHLSPVFGAQEKDQRGQCPLPSGASPHQLAVGPEVAGGSRTTQSGPSLLPRSHPSILSPSLERGVRGGGWEESVFKSDFTKKKKKQFYFFVQLPSSVKPNFVSS